MINKLTKIKTEESIKYTPLSLILLTSLHFH